MAFGKGSKVETGTTSGTVVSEIKHPVTRNTTGVVVQPSGTSSTNDQVVASPRNVKPGK